MRVIQKVILFRTQLNRVHDASSTSNMSFGGPISHAKIPVNISRLETPEMAASHFLQVQVKSQVISLQVQVKSQVISLQVKVKSQVISLQVQVKSQVTSHLVQTQVKSQVSLSKYKSSSTLFCPAVIRNQGQASNQSTVSYSQRYRKWSMVFNNFY